MLDDSFEAVFAHATIGIIIIDQQGRLLAANHHACALLGYRAEELIGLSVDTLVPDSVAPHHHQLRDAFNHNPQVRAIGHGRELYAKRKDGSVFPAEISLSYFYRQQALLTIGYLIDTTAQHQAQQTLLAQKAHIEQLNAELEQKVADRTHALQDTLHQLRASRDELSRALAAEQQVGELKSRFVTMASHEFRTPLTAMLSSVSLLEKYNGAEQQAQRLRHMERIKTSINQLNSLLGEFLLVGQLQQGGLQATWSRIQVTEVVQEVVMGMQPHLKAGQYIATHLDCPEPVLTDPALLGKILAALLSNASKFSPPHQSIEVKVRQQGAGFQVVVRDTGMGISPEDQAQLFDQFFRAKNALNIGGTGLGLYLAAQYVALLSGSLALDSQLGEGTQVTLSFPSPSLPDEQKE
ncbi:PAS domain-containing sensor histidine kinase [Spirosoma aerophilum]